MTNSEKTLLKNKKKEIPSKKGLTAQNLPMTSKDMKLSFRSKSSKTVQLSATKTLRLLKEKPPKAVLRKDKRSSHVCRRRSKREKECFHFEKGSKRSSKNVA